MLAQIVQMVSRSSAEQGSDSARSADVGSQLAFVPAVVLVAAITFSLWLLIGPHPAFTYALVNAVAGAYHRLSLCLGLATPMSIMVAVGRGASMGVLSRTPSRSKSR